MKYTSCSIALIILAISMPRTLHGQSAKPLVELPLDFEKNLPVASIHVNGSPQLFILDSAAASCVMDDAAAAQVGLTASVRALSSGSGGMVAVGLARGARLQLSGLEIGVENVVLTSLAGLGFQKAVHGIIGFPLFGKYVVEIDYPGKAARIFTPGTFQAPQGAEIIPLWMTDGPTARGQLKLAGQEAIEADFQLDTGSSHVLTVCKPFVDRHQLLKKVAGLRAERTSGLGGTSPDMVGRIESVTLGSNCIRNPEVRFSTHAAGTLSTPRFGANLGNAFLNTWIVIFDIPGSRLMLRR